MKRTILCSIVFTACLFNSAFASHSSYSPMAPRQLTVKSAHADYSYGLTRLPGNSIDSIEPFNRNMPWKVNYYILDGYILKPVAHAYSQLPEFSKTGVHNVLSNIFEVNNTINNAFIGEFSNSATSLGRFVINSTIGLAGCFDVATHLGLEEKNINFDTVLGKAGVDNGAYFMVPGLGPYTERRIHGSIVDNAKFYFLDPVFGLVHGAVSMIEGRAALISQEEMVTKSLDPYGQTRLMLLQYTQGKVNPNESMEVQKDTNVDEFMDEID